MVACDSWLDTTPPSQVPEEDQFDDEFGFRQALIGCYIGMADVDLYGKQLTWYSVEMQSGQYSIHTQAQIYAMGTYQYTTRTDKSTRLTIPYVKDYDKEITLQ